MQLTFIDLFAGIGGFHLAFDDLDVKCVFASEWDIDARKTYEANFHSRSPDLFNSGNFAGDITEVEKAAIPDFDILTAGFPCQPFSQAGHKKGFSDTRGTLFFEIAEIMRVKQPQAFFLENVPHLLRHDGGKTFETISRVLKSDLGYSLQVFLAKASDHGLPQMRKRLFLIGFRDSSLSIEQPKRQEIAFTLSDVMGGRVTRDIGYTLRVGGRGSGIDNRRNWDAYLVDGKETRLTPDQAKRMQGFPETFAFPVTEAQAMKQLGNSVAVWAVKDYAKEIIRVLEIQDPVTVAQL